MLSILLVCSSTVPDSGGVSSSNGTPFATPYNSHLVSHHTHSPLLLTSIMGADYYKLLGVSKDASDEDIKKAYKKMVRPSSPSHLALLIFPNPRH